MVTKRSGRRGAEKDGSARTHFLRFLLAHGTKNSYATASTMPVGTALITKPLFSGQSNGAGQGSEAEIKLLLYAKEAI